MAKTAPPKVSAKFEWIYILFCFWFLTGLYFDAWSHTHHPELETFFNVPHGVLYSGFLLLAAWVLFTALRNHRAGLPWKQSMPLGYQTALWGTILFMISGAGDAVWHTLLGIEHELEAAFSPTHIGIMIGLTILVSAPFISAWRRRLPLNFRDPKARPGILGFTFLLAAFTLVTQWAHPYVEQIAATKPLDINQGQALGILGIILQVFILVGLFILVTHQGLARPGLFTIALTLDSVALSLMRGSFAMIIPALITGLAMDLMLWRWQKSKETVFWLRVLAVVTGAVFAASYFLVLFSTSKVWWSVHMWAGSIVVAGIVSLLISYLAIPPAQFASR